MDAAPVRAFARSRAIDLWRTLSLVARDFSCNGELGDAVGDYRGYADPHFRRRRPSSLDETR